MPKPAEYTLAWSPEHHIYEIRRNSTQTSRDVVPNSPNWYSWFKTIDSFAFHGKTSNYTAQKERIQGGQYWYAYIRLQKKLQKKYLGKSEALTSERLEEVATFFLRKEDKNYLPANPERSSATRKERGKQKRSGKQPLQTVQQELILATKLRVPPLSMKLIQRTELLAQLEKGARKALTLLCASAGSGKSTLLSSWVHQGKMPTAWISLNLDDNEPLRFWSYVFTTLDALAPGIGEHALSYLHSMRVPQIEHSLMLLLHHLGQSQNELALILDDYHLISETSIHTNLAFFLEHMPSQVHLFIATRTSPPLPLARFRLRDLMYELHIDDLRFTHEEAEALFKKYEVLDLSSEEIQEVEQYTEGWAAGLQIAAILLRTQKEREHILQIFRRGHQYIEAYLVEEVLEQTPEHIKQFLLYTSILEKLHARLCEAVSLQSDGQATLTWLEQANLFLIPLHDERQWYRYHHIFADTLRQHLLRSQPELVSELHRRAARWFKRERMLSEAVMHARAAGDLETIAAITEGHGVEKITHGEIMEVMNWMSMLPRPMIFSRLRLFLYQCWSMVYTGHETIAIAMLREYSKQHGLPDVQIVDATTLEETICIHVNAMYPPEQWNNEHQGNLIAETLSLYGRLNMRLSGRADLSQEVTRRAATWVADLPYRGRISQHLGVISLMRGDVQGAIAALEEGFVASMADGSIVWITTIARQLSALCTMAGQLHDKARISQQMLWILERKRLQASTTWGELSAMGQAYLMLGEVEYEYNNLSLAQSYVEKGIEADKQTDIEGTLLIGLLLLAKIRLSLGDKAGAQRYWEECETYLIQERSALEERYAEIFPTIMGLQALLAHHLGNEEPGLRWLQENKPGTLDDQSILLQLTSLTKSYLLLQARLLWLHNRFSEAENLLKCLHALAERQKRMGSLLQILTAESLLFQAKGEHAQSLTMILRALTLAEQQGYQRLFLDESSTMSTLLYDVREKLRKEPLPLHGYPSLRYINKLILRMRDEGRVAFSREKCTLIEPLSEREREVLWHISEGCSNREIAEQLVIAPSTVKSHVRAIYTKLGAASRTQALAQARRFRLL